MAFSAQMFVASPWTFFFSISLPLALAALFKLVFVKEVVTDAGFTWPVEEPFLSVTLSCIALVASMSCSIRKLLPIFWETVVCFSVCGCGGSFRDRMLSMLKECDESDGCALFSTLRGETGSVSSELFPEVNSLSNTSRIFNVTADFSTSLFSLLPGLALVFSSLRSFALLFWNQTWNVQGRTHFSAKAHNAKRRQKLNQSRQATTLDIFFNLNLLNFKTTKS